MATGEEGNPDAVTDRRIGLKELTVKGIIVGIVLALLLGAANMYVGMRVGLTVSASIPAAVLSLALLRGFKDRTIQENNIAQTIASSAEALAAGVIFTIPALLPAFLGIWPEVNILDTILIAMVGGLLGVLFAVPLRKALIVDKDLPYPEGVACAAVLRAGHGGGGARLLVAGALTGALFAFLQLGLNLFPTTAEAATRAGDALLFIGTDLSLILIGVGFLVGLRIASLIFFGGAFAWFIVLPLLSGLSGWNVLDVPSTAGLGAVDASFAIWDAKIRLIGAGAMFTGGLLAVWNLRDSLALAAREGVKGYRGAGESKTGDMPFNIVLILLALLLIPLGFLTTQALPEVWQGLTTVVVVLVAGFLLSAVAGYMAGVVGSSNNPVSGVTILALAATAGLLKIFGVGGAPGILGALFVAALIATAAAISGDTMQDLKTGHMVQATPWKQQISQILGVGLFALVAPFVLVLLDQAFTIGSQTLPAPQAGLMATFLDGFFGQGVDVLMLGGGALIGAAAALAGFAVLPVAVGVYLPLGLSAPIFVGGVL
ncbi:MAG: oligopeptide transporter, OPT family, partial [Candidatus Thermoplasmatota archaeon]|nr:oligopeptide transporter, OPT family [Candidatus Thermoplasmatota archaeon]